MFHDHIVQISENLNKRNVLKTHLQFTYPINFRRLYYHFYYEKSEDIWFFKTNEQNKKNF